MAKANFHPLSGEPQAIAVAPDANLRPELGGAVSYHRLSRPNRIKATYDAARDSDAMSDHWSNTDALSADGANSSSVRTKLRNRSRYETTNNGFVSGIVQTYANDLVGIGPKLRMQTGSAGFNAMVEAEFALWAKSVQLRRKLWCLAHSKVQDGEGFGVLRTNPRAKHRVKLDLVLYEAEQCTSPFMPFNEPGHIDGIKFDEFGNPETYYLLKYHPGGQATFQMFGQFGVPEAVPAEYVVHWFKLTRPGQHRGIPELTATLNVGASSRRMREATVSAAETAADFSVVLKTLFQPDQIDQVSPMSSVDIQKKMMTALPQGWDMSQMKAEHPNATYEAFIRSQLNETARPLNMPYNKAACDSSSYNYASGRLDHQTYYGGLDVDREDGNDLVIDPIFDAWWDEAVSVFGWLGGRPEAIGPYAKLHSWDWPKHPVADIGAEAEAHDKRLRTGSLSLRQLYSDNGEDFEDELIVLAQDYGVEPDEMRTILRDAIFNSQNQQASMQQADTQAKAAEAAAKVAQQIADKPTPAPAAQPTGAKANA